MNIFLDIGYPHQMWYDLDCTNVRKIGDFKLKKDWEFTNPKFVDRLN